jgi:hypothetical protein
VSKRVQETGQYALLQVLSAMYVRDHGGAVELTKQQVDAIAGMALTVRHDATKDKVIVTLVAAGSG